MQFYFTSLVKKISRDGNKARTLCFLVSRALEEKGEVKLLIQKHSQMVFKLKLKVFWHERVLGLAIFQAKGNYLIPITSYYCWPKTDAWEQLKLALELRPWLPEKEKIRVLNNSSEIMNYWKKNRNNKNGKKIIHQIFDFDFFSA